MAGQPKVILERHCGNCGNCGNPVNVASACGFRSFRSLRNCRLRQKRSCQCDDERSSHAAPHHISGCACQDGGGAATTREKVPRTLKSCITRAYSKTCDAARCTYREIIWRRDQPIGQSPRPCFVDVVARRLGPQVVQPSLRLVFIFGRASV